MGNKLLHMMFGKTTASLKQLAARTIFTQCFLEGSNALGKILPVNTIKDRFSGADLQQIDVYDEYISLVLNKTVLKALVTRLGLPQDSIVNFEIELLLHQMASRFSSYKLLPPENVFSGESDDSLSLTDSDVSASADEGDSDLEYW